MLELVDLNKKVAKAEYAPAFAELVRRVGDCQRAARAGGMPIVLVFEGWEAAGKGTVINRLTQALDPRGFKVMPISAATSDERRRPWLWRFWMSLPAAGSITIFDRSWYGRVLVERMAGLSEPQWRQAYEEIRQFERGLGESGTLVIKFWLHLAKKEQKRRFRRLGRHPSTAWKVGKAEWQQHHDYHQWLKLAEEMLVETSTSEAPWTIVEATQRRYCRLQVFQTFVNAVESELQRRATAQAAAAAVAQATVPAAATPPADAGQAVGQAPAGPLAAATEPAPREPSVLDGVNLGLALAPEQYAVDLKSLQQRLLQLEHELYLAQIPAVIVYEGWDAGGKGGNIRRLTAGLDPRGYEVIPIAAPSAEEKSRHYLWRFWRHLPKTGHITIFDRSWYGRVLVERVEGFCSQDEWRRAYEEINVFERELAKFGTVVVKFWLHISRDEQLRRFEDRQRTREKSWKITDEDWRNRAKWPQYEAAVNEMLQRTSTRYAPWTVLEANDKLYARVKALRTVAEALERALQKGPGEVGEVER